MTSMTTERYELLAPIIKALSHPLRLRLIDLLKEGPRNVSSLSKSSQSEISVVSRHLSILKQAGIIDKQSKGKEVFYNLLTPCVNRFLCCVEQVLKQKTSTPIKKVRCTTKCSCTKK